MAEASEYGGATAATGRMGRHVSALAGVLRALPLAVWLLVLSVVLGLAHYSSLDAFVERFNAGFGRAAADFVLIILPAFVIANALSVSKVRANEGVGVLLSPVLGAGMICPDTAYATLSPFARRRKQMMAYGAYAGFKLLYPAGPLIIATGMGVAYDARLLLLGVVIFVPVWLCGLLWARRAESGAGAAEADGAALTSAGTSAGDESGEQRRRPVVICFGLLIGLIVAGLAWQPSTSLLQYLVSPKGALAAAALGAMYFAVRHAGDTQVLGEILQKAIRQTAGLIFVIGLAAALGAVLSDVFEFDRMVYGGSSTLALVLAGFATAALFKVIQGSSMATFAAVAPIAGYLVVNLPGMEAALVVYAVCAGSMIAILPNDSFFWLVRTSLAGPNGDRPGLLRDLVIGSTLQACVGLIAILAIYLGVVAL